MSAYRILLLCDHRWRDVPALALLKREIQAQIEADVRVISFDLHQLAVELFDPHLVVINHLHGNRNQHIADTVRRRGGLAVVLPTEGRPNSESQLHWATNEWPPELCNLYLCWSDEFRARLPDSVSSITTGCLRFDFYFHPLSRIILSRDDSAGRLGLDPRKKTITIASSFPNAKFATSGSVFHERDWKDLRVTKVAGREFPVEFARLESIGLSEFRSWIVALRSNFPDHQIAVKPHPAESVNEWREFGAKTDVSICLGGYIWDFLAISDLHIARADCLTLCDAWAMGVKTIALKIGDVGDDGPGREALDYTRTAQTVAELLSPTETGRFSPQDYIEKWITPSPGAARRCAQAVADLLREKIPTTHKEPTPAEGRELWRLVLEHAQANRYPSTDGVGQFGKTARQMDVDECALLL